MRTHLVLTLAGTLAFLLTACGSDTTEDASTTPSSPGSSMPAPSAPTDTASADDGEVLEVKIAGDSVSPSGERVKAEAGEPITFVVTSDRPGALHVHSSPEQSPEFTAGVTTIEVTVDRPGLVEVEEHESDQLIVQLEVR